MKSPTLRRDLITISILWVILSVLGEWGSEWAIRHFPGTASAEGVVTSDAFFFLLRVTVPMLILLALIIVYAAIRFRVADDDRTPSAAQYRSARAFPWTWVTISVVLNVLFIIHPGITGLDALWAMAAKAKNPMEVDVTAKQWEWSFDYPAQKISDVGQLVVPVDRPIRFVIRSDDVIHSFWVPAWGIKKAAIPGETRTLVITPDRILSTTADPLARVQCSQICGVGHTDMHAALRVVSAQDFSAWAAKTRQAQQEDMGGMNMKMNMKGGSGGMNSGGMNSGGMNSGGMNSGGMKMNMNGSGGSNAGGGQMNMSGSGSMNSGGSQMNMQGSGSMNSGGSQMNMQGSGSMNSGGGQMNMQGNGSMGSGGGQMKMQNGNGQMNMNDKQSGGGSQ